MIYTDADRRYLAEMENAVARAAYERMHDATASTKHPIMSMLSATEGREFVTEHWDFYIRNRVTILDEWCWP